jgi:hypothetical protein
MSGPHWPDRLSTQSIVINREGRRAHTVQMSHMRPRLRTGPLGVEGKQS